MLGSSGYEAVLFENPDSLARIVGRQPSDYGAIIIDMSEIETLPPEISTFSEDVPVIMLIPSQCSETTSHGNNEPFKLGSPLSIPRLLRLLQRLSREKQLTTPSNETKKKHAMVVDDCPSIRLFVREILKSIGYKVTEAENGLEALNILRSASCPDISTFVVDLEMPEIDGPTLIRELNKLYESPEIIITTGTKDINLLTWARTTGMACGLIEKPFSSKAFIRFLSAQQD